ncbi:MAG: RluA family pseudouridine synthase [Oscillospiraceae bacterium]|jgi:23S rRNA pseudouridine1911/1915/1917 synthase|nr:RluA family pseudouridine synthase [Oscillospiraceae bacterium]
MTTLFSTSDGERLDVFLAANIQGLTRNAAQKLIESGNVTLNSKTVRKNHKITLGEAYNIIQNEPKESAVTGQDIRLDVVFEDNDLIVINKPRGMVVHPAPGHSENTLVNALLYHCGESLSGIGGVIRPGIVHRLDKETSGLIIVAKNDASHLSLASQLSSRTLKREYDAIVYGIVKNDNGIINAPIGRHQKDRKKQAVTGINSREAITHYEVVTRYERFTHIKCRLETGRTHQIRVHLSHINHPILGDSVYGIKKSEKGLSSQCLHASMLGFNHPKTGEYIEVKSVLPRYFTEVLGRLV